jgi:medium-chain acyl-[acyl-carrier-protein] hydrolase
MRAEAGASARTVRRDATVAFTGPSDDPYLGSISRAEPSPRLRLFCVPHAGGGTSSFRGWARSFPPGVQLVPVQLPGRESRVEELPFVRLAPLVSALTEAVGPYVDVPFALFGHSMGALVCFELARYLRRAYGVAPVHLFVSGAPAPQLSVRHPAMHELSTPALLGELRRLGGTPDEVLNSEELMRMLVPVLRADLQIVETYSYFADAPLSCPISAFGGLGDARVTRDELAAWRVQTAGEFTQQMVPGGHFFAYDEGRRMANIVARELGRALRGSSGPGGTPPRRFVREEVSSE